MELNDKARQCRRIMDFVDKHGSINPLQALKGLGVMRLAARISDLEKVDKGNRELLELMTGASVEAQKQLHVKSRQYYAAIQNLTDAKRLRERWIVIGGFLTSFIATAFALGTIFMVLGR